MERGDDSAGCCCMAARGDEGALTATMDDRVASVATDGCTGWMGGGELSDSHLRLDLVATFCSTDLGLSASCSGGCGWLLQTLVVLDG